MGPSFLEHYRRILGTFVVSSMGKRLVRFARDEDGSGLGMWLQIVAIVD